MNRYMHGKQCMILVKRALLFSLLFRPQIQTTNVLSPESLQPTRLLNLRNVPLKNVPSAWNSNKNKAAPMEIRQFKSTKSNHSEGHTSIEPQPKQYEMQSSEREEEKEREKGRERSLSFIRLALPRLLKINLLISMLHEEAARVCH